MCLLNDIYYEQTQLMAGRYISRLWQNISKDQMSLLDLSHQGDMYKLLENTRPGY